MLIEVLESIGVIVKWIADNAVTVKIPKTFSLNTIDRALARKLPSIIMIIPSLLHHLDSFELPLVGTNRTRRVHGTILKSFGINMEIKKDSENPCLLISKNKKAQQLESLVMPEASDTGMQVALIMSLLQKNPLILYGAQENYMTQDLMGFISKLGCTITRNNSLSITISSEQLVTEKNIEYCNSEDPTESFFFVALAIITKSNLSIKRVPVDFLRFEFAHLEAMGQKISYSQEYLSYNEITKLVDITLTPSELSNTEKVIHALPYPGINTDNLPLFVAICAHAGGTATLLDWMNEDRILYYRELKKFGMKIETAGSHKLFITDSRESMHETSFFCSEQFRPSTLLLLLALSIEGTSNLRNIYAIKRGYEKLDERLKEVGAQIELVTSIL
jgi:UDP-N-acetylglucosamine 1-carboxyvinyltransferase